MTAPTRFQLGKKDPKGAPSLKAAKYFNLAALANFPAVDYGAHIDWSGTLNGNGAAGDCVACQTANARTVTTGVLTGTPSYPTQDQVWSIYQTQNKNFDPNGSSDTNGPGSNDDQGMDLQTLWEFLVKNPNYAGIGTLVGFAQLDHTNLQELRNAVSLGGSVALGVQVAEAQQQQFPNTWDYVEGSPIEGGHAILAVGHEDTTANELRIITWAAELALTEAFISHQVDEAWLLIWEDDLGSERFVAGMDLATFAADYTAITGRTFPAVVPDPTPQPDPVPVPPEPTPDPDPTPVPPVTPPVPDPVPPVPDPDPVPPVPDPDPTPPVDEATALFARQLKRWLKHFPNLSNTRRIRHEAETWLSSGALSDDGAYPAVEESDPE